MEIKKIRLLGYYSSPNQKMNPESERIEDAYTLAPLLESSINSLLSNPTIDLELKQNNICDIEPLIYCKFPNLKFLSLERNKISDISIKYIYHLNLHNSS